MDNDQVHKRVRLDVADVANGWVCADGAQGIYAVGVGVRYVESNLAEAEAEQQTK